MMPARRPTASKFLDVEMLRDGGSWTVSFTGDDGRKYILFSKILFGPFGPSSIALEDLPARPLWATSVSEREWLGHGEPVLIDAASRLLSPLL